VLLLGQTLATSTPALARELAVLPGIRAVKEYSGKSGSKSFNRATFSNPNVSGLTLRIGWNAIQPTSAGVFNWSPIDLVFSQAGVYHKTVTLLVVPGFDSPAWALAPPVAWGSFVQQVGFNDGQTSPLPMPWDTTYLSRWTTFVQALAQRYAANASFHTIAVAGPTSVSVEMSEPADPTSLALWQSLGYTASLYINAWQQMFTLYDQLFPRQWISLSLAPGLPIDAQGQFSARQKPLTREAVLNAGMVYRRHFSLQTSGLSAHGDPELGYALVQSKSGQVLTGFQMSSSATEHPRQMGNVNDPVDALYLSIQQGLAAGIEFLEVYERDILNASSVAVTKPIVGQTMQTVMANAIPRLLPGPT
jgi:hypothetical protein